MSLTSSNAPSLLSYYYVLLAPISRGTLPRAMHGHAPWLLAGSLHSSPAGAFAGTPRNVLCPLQSVAPLSRSGAVSSVGGSCFVAGAGRRRRFVALRPRARV